MDELRRVAETYKSDFEIAKQRTDDVQKEYNQAVTQAEQNNQAQVVLSDLESKSKTYRSLYENFLQRYMDTVQQQSFPITEARMISSATRPQRKSSPKTFITLAISTCMGIIFGLGIGVLRDLWDRVFRTTEQVEKALHTTCIAVVPILKASARALPLMPSPPTDENRATPTIENLAVTPTIEEVVSPPVGDEGKAPLSLKGKSATRELLTTVILPACRSAKKKLVCRLMVKTPARELLVTITMCFGRVLIRHSRGLPKRCGELK